MDIIYLDEKNGFGATARTCMWDHAGFLGIAGGEFELTGLSVQTFTKWYHLGLS